MNVLLGLKQGDLLTALQAYYMLGNTLTAVHDQEPLLAAASQNSYGMIIVHIELFQEAYPWDWVEHIRAAQPAAKIVIIPDDIVYDSLWLEVLYRLAEERGMFIAPLDSAAEHILRLTEGFEDEPSITVGAGTAGKGVIAAVWPAASKDGATTVAINTALMLARHTPLRIGLLDLNLKNPEIRAGLNLAEKSRSNAALRSKLQTGALRPGELWDACIPYRQTPELRILPGSRRRDTAGDVTPEMMQHLMDVCRSTFEITIADLSVYPDNAATVCAARSADIRWLIAQQSFVSYRSSWNEWYECYWKFAGVSPERMSLVVNRYSPHGESPQKVADTLGMKLAGILPNVPGGAGVQAMQEGTPLCEMAGAGAFMEGVYHLASDLSVSAGATPLQPLRGARRNGILSSLSALFS